MVWECQPGTTLKQNSSPVSAHTQPPAFTVTILIIALALVVGLLLGILGGGGSILTVPIFVYVLGFDPKEAIGQSLLVVGVTSVAASFGHWRSGHVRWKLALIFGVVAMIGAVAGARISVYMSGRSQLVLFAVVMLVASFFMMRGRRSSVATAGDVASGAAPDGGEPHLRPHYVVLLAFGVGVVTGVVGVGGGFMIVPALTLLGRIPIHQAVGTSLVIISMNGLAGFGGYLGQVEMNWPVVASFTGFAIIGSLFGSAMARRVPAASLRRGFAVFLVFIASFILYQNRDAFGLDVQQLPAASSQQPAASS